MHLIPDIPGIPDNTIIPLCAVTFTCTLPYIYPFTADNGYLYARFCCVVCRLRQPDIIIASVRIALVRIALAFLSSVQQGRALERDFVALNRLSTHCHTNWKDTGKPPKCGCLWNTDKNIPLGLQALTVYLWLLQLHVICCTLPPQHHIILKGWMQ